LKASRSIKILPILLPPKKDGFQETNLVLPVTGNRIMPHTEKNWPFPGDWDSTKFVFPRQTHSDHVAIVDSANQAESIADTDAVITNEPGLFVCVQTADCVPILLYDPQKKVVAAIHAGWKGTVSKIAQKAICKMTEQYGSNPADIVAGIGPSIHMHAYEVGPEVVDQVKANFDNTGVLLKPSTKRMPCLF